MAYARRLVLILAFMLSAPSAHAEAPAWDVSMTQSSLTFTGKQMGTPFNGAVGKFKADVRFDPDHPESGHAVVDIDATTIGTGDTDRDKTAATPAWFDFTRFPAARFAADSFKKTGSNAFEAHGTLTIKNVSVPIVVPFTFTPVLPSDKPQARVKGTATLDRSKFGLGTGEWADTSVIANEVTVAFDLVAYTKK